MSQNAAQAVAEWRRKHPLQAIAARAGLRKAPEELQYLEEAHAPSARFLEGSQRRLKEFEQSWVKNHSHYEQQLEREGRKIIEARKYTEVIDTLSGAFPPTLATRRSVMEGSTPQSRTGSRS